MKIRRFDRNPLIHQDLDGLKGLLGSNINGPSIIRTPDWIKNPLGKYYLYFAHHKGSYIRLAYADSIEGPWRLHSQGVLHLEEAPCEDHIASPDVHIDNENKKIIMYFHGKAKSEHFPGFLQLSFVGISQDGLSFDCNPKPLGPFYFRVFDIKEGHFYAFAKNKNDGGFIMKSRAFDEPFEIVKEIIPNMRHGSILIKDSLLYLFYSKIGDNPERILCTSFSLDKEPAEWEVREEFEVLKPETEYEGTDLPLEESTSGKSEERVRQLRDPEIFEDEGNLYLFYTNAGEQGISGCEILNFEFDEK